MNLPYQLFTELDLTTHRLDEKLQISSAALLRNAGSPKVLRQSSRRLGTHSGMSMSTDSSPDPASLEKLFASVFAVQSSGLDSESISALAQLRRLIMMPEADLAHAMDMVAEYARAIADATGVAVAQLVGNQLVYRAGSGGAAAYIGRHVTAVLSASASNEARSEILRVENAQADTRIEAEVCRLYGANALLIVPIYRQHVVVGVIEVFFNDPHTFGDQEVLTYRIMAGLVEEAMCADAQRAEKQPVVAQVKLAPRVMEASTFPADKLDDKFGTPQKKFVLPDSLRWNVATAGLAAVLVVAGLAYHHRLASLRNAASSSTSNAVQPVSANPSQTNVATSNSESPAGPTDSRPPGSAFRRVRVGQDEVDYIAEDVTIRHFTSNAARPQMLAGERLVNFGEDVTVRYFGPKPRVAPQIQPVPAAERSVER